ncbi:MAG: hypothetical protein CVV42_18535 [Candidatus Riflebacteria bacterium HGW-Riflebacteria-2]|jgi:hypothetical protein|nr:MAG: hypothetical protein CVV42_18535 [Candidatus Riflebacteria bacterium HGW-Riflebacteria-2]
MDKNIPLRTFLTSAKDRADGQISPVFGYLVLGFLWVGCFGLMSMDEAGPPLRDRLLFASLITAMAASVGFYLFQSYDLVITSHSVKWESHVVPHVWVERWEEPIANYQGICLLQTQPISSFWPLKYTSAKLFYPQRISHKSMTEADHKFNESKFVVVYLKHAHNSSRDVSLQVFDADAVDDIKKYCLGASESLNLPIKN